MPKQRRSSKSEIEKSDPQKLKLEVLDHGYEASLPCNLSDDWLTKLERDSGMVLSGQIEDHCYKAAPFAIVTKLLEGKCHASKGLVTFSDEELLSHMRLLHYEICVELIRRKGYVTPPPATLETILTDRVDQNSAKE